MSNGSKIFTGIIKFFKQHTLSTVVFIVALIAFIGLAIYRFYYGLGVTGLSDLTPWGLWTALKLFLVVASGCAFTLTGMVYIFNMERFRPLVRSAALMGLIGYSTFAITLIFELGWPWRIIHPIWMHNFHSILFEVAWCVIIYLTILTLEFIPNILEKLKMATILKLFKKFTPGLVIAGIILSILHQSSLGSLFVMAPYKMNHLWYSPWLGPFFIISAVFCGLAMIIIAELLMAKFDRRKPRTKLIADLGRYSIIMLGLYLGFKIMDVLERSSARAAFLRFDFHTIMFVIEIFVGILLPILLYTNKKITASARGLGITASLVLLFGGALNRLNVSVFAYDHGTIGYQPTFIEYLYIPAIIIIISGIYVITTRILPILKTNDTTLD